jgi:uncharacterized membrane protein YfcA
MSLGVSPDLALKLALGTSFVIICPTAFFTTYNHYKTKKFNLKPGIILGIFGIIGSFIGSLIAIYLPYHILETLLGLTFILLAINMFYSSFKNEKTIKSNDNVNGVGGSAVSSVNDNGISNVNDNGISNGIDSVNEMNINIFQIGLLGLVIGLFSGLFSLGGGAFLIPTLTLLIGLSMISAIRISSVFITITSIGGILSYLINGLFVKTIEYSVGYINLINFIVITIFAIGLTALGTKMAYRVNDRVLKILFSIFIVYMGLKLLGFDPFILIFNSFLAF